MRIARAHPTLAALMLLAFSAHAQTVMRCGTDLITPGDTKEQVLTACGEPDYVEGYRRFYNTETKQPRIIVFTGAGRVEAIKTVL